MTAIRRLDQRLRLNRARARLRMILSGASRALVGIRDGRRPAIRSTGGVGGTPVESYWGRHTVNTLRVWTRRSSERQLERRFDQYPLFREFSGLWGDHDGETLLDYGCGPGNDLVGFALYTGATKIIGIDVSRTALDLAADRLALHRVDPARVELMHASEAQGRIDLPDASVDFLQSQGVLHHASDPEPTLRELHRVLKPAGTGCIMVYNRDSVWFHLYVAYELMLRDGAFAGLCVEDAFAMSTDGPDCPIARSYRGPDFVALCEAAGFEAEYLGGYLSNLELHALTDSAAAALADSRLASEQRQFLEGLALDDGGYPRCAGSRAGIGGTYRLRRTPE